MKELEYLKNVTVIERKDPVNPEALKEIREILEGIKSGRLLHNQESYHTQTECGTAHCIAGWKAHNDAIKAGLNLTYTVSKFDEEDVLSDELDGFMFNKIGTSSEWRYAKSQWGLISLESEMLFDSDATLDQQFELLEVLELGYTIKI